MHIGINGWFCSLPYTGIGQYTISLIKALSRLADNHLISVFIAPVDGIGNLPELPNVEYCTVDKKSRSNDVFDVLEFEFLLVKLASVREVDVLHTTYLSSSQLHGKDFKHVVTVHDLIPRVFKKYRGSYLRQFYLWHSERTVKNADLIITDSAHSQLDIDKYLGIGQAAVKVIPIAADEVFTNKTEENRFAEIKKKYSLPDDYIFYIGGFDYRKNVATLLEAFAKARRSGIKEKLVLAGKFSPSVKQLARGLVENIPQIVDALRIDDFVTMAGMVPQEDLPYLYKMARLFVYPSLYEGFGLPPLEAMSCGTPVLASQSSSIPEIIDRDELLFDPCDAQRLAEKICWLLSDDTLRKSVVDWGLDRAKTFSWPDTARETLDLYQSLCGGSVPKKRIGGRTR